MLGYLIRRLSERQRLRLAERVLPEPLGEPQKIAAERFKSRRQEWTKFALVGCAAALGALLATASWEGAAVPAAKALAASAQGFVAALACSLLAAALGVMEEVFRVKVAHKPDLPDEPAWDQEEFHRRHHEQEWHDEHAHRTIPAALRWYMADWGATIFLVLAAVIFVASAADAAHRIAQLGAPA